MRKLFTDFIQIGTSGATTDGRNIEAEWLTKIAANYDPEKYTALISWEHREKRYFGNYGKVHAVEARDVDDGKTGLFAVIAPNEYLVAMNKDSQSLFPSMEIDLDFSDTGEPYLTGLAVTDEPACLSTGELSFSRKKQTDNADDKHSVLVFNKLDAFQDLVFSHTPPTSTPDSQSIAQAAFSKAEMGLVRRLLKHFSNPGGDTTNNDTNDGDPMTPEEKAQFAQLSKDVASLTTAVTASNETVTALGEKFSAIKPAEDDDKTGEGKTADTQTFSEIKAELESTQKTVLALSEKLSAAIGTPAGNTDDGGDDSGEGEDPDNFV